MSSLVVEPKALYELCCYAVASQCKNGALTAKKTFLTILPPILIDDVCELIELNLEDLENLNQIPIKPWNDAEQRKRPKVDGKIGNLRWLVQ
jgi:hypothetical protein